MNIINSELDQYDKGIFFNREIFLMGRLEHVEDMLRWFEKNGIIVQSILDNDKSKQGNIFLGKKIDNPEIVLSKKNKGSCLVIIYSPRHWNVMLKQLFEYGLSDGENIIILNRPSEYRNIELIKKGIEIYDALLDEFGENSWFFIANCPIGDYFLLCSYFERYCQLNNISQYVMLGSSLGIEKISDAFNILKRKRLTNAESEALLSVWKFLGEKRIHVKPITIWQGDFRFNPCLTRLKNGLTFMDTIKTMVFGLEDNCKRKMPVFFANEQFVKKTFWNKELIPGKTVLLVPFSYSQQSLPQVFWNDLTGELNRRGYSVAVNIGEERETNMIEGTVPVRFSFADIGYAMKYAGLTIGMRSGFFDVTSNVKTKRIVIYPIPWSGRISWNRMDRAFCSLSVMGLCNNAVEIDAERDWKKTIEKIGAIIDNNNF